MFNKVPQLMNFYLLKSKGQSKRSLAEENEGVFLGFLKTREK